MARTDQLQYIGNIKRANSGGFDFRLILYLSDLTIGYSLFCVKYEYIILILESYLNILQRKISNKS